MCYMSVCVCFAGVSFTIMDTERTPPVYFVCDLESMPAPAHPGILEDPNLPLAYPNSRMAPHPAEKEISVHDQDSEVVCTTGENQGPARRLSDEWCQT